MSDEAVVMMPNEEKTDRLGRLSNPGMLLGRIADALPNFAQETGGMSISSDRLSGRLGKCEAHTIRDVHSTQLTRHRGRHLRSLASECQQRGAQNHRKAEEEPNSTSDAKFPPTLSEETVSVSFDGV